jgi:hypothetical protein
MRHRLHGDGLLMVKAASKSNRSGDDDGESQKDTHDQIPRSLSLFSKRQHSRTRAHSRRNDYNVSGTGNCDILATIVAF